MNAAPGASADPSFVHPALFYRDREEYLRGTVPFVRAGLEAGEPVAVAVPGPQLKLLRDAVGDGSDVLWQDMHEAGRNPGRIIPGVLRAFADGFPHNRVRIIGEPIWPGRSATEYPACAQHEALINLAFEGRAVTILCPYDAAGLEPGVLADARATHPTLIDHEGTRESPEYAPHRVIDDQNVAFPAPPRVPGLMFDLESLPRVRAFVCGRAAERGLGSERVSVLELIVNELASNSVLHGGGTGTVRLWAEQGHIVCEVSDTGRIADRLAGRRPVNLGTKGGRGMLLVNHLADLVRIHTGPAGTTIRAYMRLPTGSS
ncbi:anti-sigma factor RsbA family regulatory protein [Spirillospora sp. CA-294931]|uniref:anti-sigma factor RsbA family regulatory protein n=1 Tax=Spirillospora sp. CA-294931 TaxID=3240042 RepID=UPI003D8B7560